MVDLFCGGALRGSFLQAGNRKASSSVSRFGPCKSAVDLSRCRTRTIMRPFTATRRRTRPPLETPSPQTAPSRASGTSRVCPACARTTAHILRFQKNGSDIIQCSACGLGRAETTDFDPTTYYTADYFSGGHADGYSDYLGAEAVLRREFASTVDFIRDFRTGGKLLEIGCAYRFFSKRRVVISKLRASN